ncbi:MAG: hypothetical protein HRF42_05785 [Candidatus Brocadia sp.]|jgi:ribonuclease HII
MVVIAGIDEAGYGPALGPMIVTVVAFDVPEEKADYSLWELLKDAVSDRRKARRQQLTVRDSKKVFHTRDGLKALEDAVLSFLWIKGLMTTSFFQLLRSLSCYNSDVIAQYPWYADMDFPLPLTTNISAIANYADMLRYALRKHNMQFSYVSSCVVTVHEFNEQVRSFGNKSVVLFNNCAVLISRLWNLYDGDICLIVDKQGGRNTYTNLLKERLPTADIEVLTEGAKISTYEAIGTSKTMKISFVEKGEDMCMAVALASMFSKYIRELFMRLENQYWVQLLPGLKPTAGYYRDAQRFLAQIARVKQREAILDDILIRIK